MMETRVYRGLTALLLGVLASNLLVGCGRTKAEEEKKAESATFAVEFAVAEEKPVEETVQAQGTLSAGQGASARVMTTLTGRILEVRVREGERVTAGQIVAIVDNRPQQALARSAAAALTTAAAQYRQAELATRATAADQENAVRVAQTALDAAKLDRDNSIRTAKTGLEAAEVDLLKTRTGSRPQEIAQAAQAVTQAKETRDRAKIEADRSQSLYEKGFIPKRQLDDAVTALAVAESALESARQQDSLVRTGNRPEDIRAAELRLQLAKETLTQAKTAGAAKVTQAEATLRQAVEGRMQVAVKQQEAVAMRTTIVQKQADFAAAQATAAYSEIRAPLSGIVTKRIMNPGDMADPTISPTILEINDTHALNLIANLPAAEGERVRAGMTTHITTPDSPGKTFPGSVLSIGQIDPQTNLLSVRIAVENADGKLKVGAFAQAEIVISARKNGVLVPRQAVVTQEEKTVVFVAGADGVAHRREVTLGQEQKDLIEIRTGLKAGEKVVRLGNYELTDGAKIKEAEKESAPDEGKGEKEKTAKPEEGAAKPDAKKEEKP